MLDSGGSRLAGALRGWERLRDVYLKFFGAVHQHQEARWNFVKLVGAVLMKICGFEKSGRVLIMFVEDRLMFPNLL